MDTSIPIGISSIEGGNLQRGLSEGQSNVKLTRRQERKLRIRRELEGLKNSHTGDRDEMLQEGQSNDKLTCRQRRKLRIRRALEGLEISHTGERDKMLQEDFLSMKDAPLGHVEPIVNFSSESGLKGEESNGGLTRSKRKRERKRRKKEKNRVNALEDTDVCSKIDAQVAVNIGLLAQPNACISLSQEICQGKEGNSMDNALKSFNSSIDSQMADGRKFKKEDLNSVKEAVELKNVKESPLISEKKSDSHRSRNTTVGKTQDLHIKGDDVLSGNKDISTFQGKEAVKRSKKKRRKSSGINEESIMEANMKQTSFDHIEKEHRNGFSENHLTVEEEKHIASEQVMDETSARILDNLSVLKECKKRTKRKSKEASRGNSLMKDVSQTVSNKSLEKVYHPKKKLLVLDLNGILVDVVQGGMNPDIRVSRKAVYKRPFCDDFLTFCFERFNVGVWSSRRKKNVTKLVNFIFGESKQNLLFCWDEKHCTKTGFKTTDKQKKPIVLKELRKLWEKWNPNFPWELGQCNETNTLLVDDSPYKALRNPAHTAVFPYPYDHNNAEDSSLGPGGDVRMYLEGIAAAENVQNYVEQNPFGQPAITESDPSWDFYLNIISAVQSKAHHKRT